MTDRAASPSQFDIEWVDSEREPQIAPNPAYPTGKDIDFAPEAPQTCIVPLLYPARRIGAYLIGCKLCGVRVACTTAGRPDDPRSARIPCGRPSEPFPKSRQMIADAIKEVTGGRS